MQWWKCFFFNKIHSRLKEVSLEGSRCQAGPATMHKAICWISQIFALFHQHLARADKLASFWPWPMDPNPIPIAKPYKMTSHWSKLRSSKKVNDAWWHASQICLKRPQMVQTNDLLFPLGHDWLVKPNESLTNFNSQVTDLPLVIHSVLTAHLHPVDQVLQLRIAKLNVKEIQSSNFARTVNICQLLWCCAKNNNAILHDVVFIKMILCCL